MTMLRSMRFVTLLGGLATLCLLIAAPAQATHPRPVGASPARMSLVPAYAPCAAPNRTHGPPLAFPSCNPPPPDLGAGDGRNPGRVRWRSKLPWVLQDKRARWHPRPARRLGCLRQDGFERRPLHPDRRALRRCECRGPGGLLRRGRLQYAIRFTDHYNAVAPVAALIPPRCRTQTSPWSPAPLRALGQRRPLSARPAPCIRLTTQSTQVDQGQQTPGRRDLGSACVRRRSRRRRQHDRRQRRLPAAGHLHPIAVQSRARRPVIHPHAICGPTRMTSGIG